MTVYIFFPHAIVFYKQIIKKRKRQRARRETKLISNAFPQWNNNRYLKTTGLHLPTAHWKGKKWWMWELCDIALRSAGFCSAGPPGSRELEWINEDAKATPRLSPLMVWWYTNVEADNTICHMASMPQELLLCNLANEKPRYAFCVHVQACACQAHLDYLFSRGMRDIDLYPQRLWVYLSPMSLAFYISQSCLHP